MSENKSNEFISQVAQKEYEYGFTTDVHTETIQKGLSEDVYHPQSILHISGHHIDRLQQHRQRDTFFFAQ